MENKGYRYVFVVDVLVLSLTAAGKKTTFNTLAG